MNNFHADLLIVTATKIETMAVFSAFRSATKKEPNPQPVGGKTYHYLGIVNDIRVYLVQSEMGAIGLGAAQQTIQKGIDALTPSAVIMVGIAFGVNPEKQQIGDILVSKQLILYEPQRIGTKGKNQRVIPRGTRADCSPMLLDRCRAADQYWRGQTVRFGMILSGEKLIDNLDFRQHLLTLEPEAIGGEMEGAGLYVACQDKKVDWILVKAICDWADGLKEQGKDGSLQRQELAANNAARFVLHIIQHVGVLNMEGKQRERSSQKQPVSSKNILVVDDEPEVRRNIEKTLEREGYSVITAGDYVQALEELESHHFDLIVLDIIMPDFTGKLNKEAGLHALQDIRNKKLDMPVIMLSANKDVKLAVKVIKYGASDYFVKGDFNPEEFLKKIREHLYAG